MKHKAFCLRERLSAGSILRVVGAHDGLGARLIERNGFDGIWASGLEISTSRAVPDANILTMTEHLEAATAINEATSLPVICDCDTGYGNAANVAYMVRKYEAAGLAAVVIEDKRFPKINSFIPGRQELASVEEFSVKLRAAKEAQRDPGFLVFARVEALIAGWGQEEALRRAEAYVQAGADGIVIHSKSSTPDEIFIFTRRWAGAVPLIVIPTTYYRVTAEELARHGIRMVIYANQGLRASIRVMDETFRTIRETDSTEAVEGSLASLDEVFELQGMVAMREQEARLQEGEGVGAIIPAALDHRRQSDLGELLEDRPLCMLEIGGKPLIDRQLDLLRSIGVRDIVVIGGYRIEQLKAAGARILRNAEYAVWHSAHSIMLGSGHMKGKTIILYSDIIFDRQILCRLLESPYQITLMIDRAYQTLPMRNKRLDLVSVKQASSRPIHRQLDATPYRTIQRLGKTIDQQKASHEFVGIAFFREQGLLQLRQAWEEARSQFQGRQFYEAPSVERAGFTDLLQYLIDRGHPVNGLEIEHGWSEVHSLDDYKRLNESFQASESAVAMQP